MAPPGGAANAYGILYQILGSVHRVVRLSIRSGDLQDPASPTLVVIEPIGGGGDLREVDQDGKRIAIQFKTRSTGRSWSLTDIIADVLPDLYKAVDDHRLALPDEYHFVTEGRIGAWEEAAKFFEELAGGEPPNDPLSALSDTILVKTSPQVSVSQRQLFERSVLEIRSALTAAAGCAGFNEPVEITRRKVWHLLRGLRFLPRTIEQLKEAIDSQLRPIVSPGEAVEDVRGRLIVQLLELAGQGNAEIDPEQLIASARVTLAPLKAFAEMRARLQAPADRYATQLGYRSDADVRTPLRWGDSRILLLAGESGNGKSWALCHLARRGLDDGIVVVKTASASGQDTWSRALETLWRSLEFEGTGSLDALLKRVRAAEAGIRPQHLDVLVDNVQEAVEASYLIERALDEPPDVRLALTVPLKLGRSLKEAHGDNVTVVEIGRFDGDEFESFCEMRALDWRRIPHALRSALRHPLLAEMYSRIVGTGTGQITPQSEYEVFDSYWRRLTDQPEQHEHPGDACILAALAAETLEARRPSTVWTQLELRDHGADDGWQTRVQRVGWLQRSGGDVQIWHDRLFGWAAAKGVVEQRRAGALSAEALAQLLSSWAGRTGNGSPYDNLALDVLWLLADSEGGFAAEVPALLEAIEQVVEAHVLHEVLLPRLGLRICSALVDRLRHQSGDHHRIDRAARHAAATLVALARYHPTEIAAEAGKLINDPSPFLRKAGLIALGTVPNSAVLDRLWELHRDSVTALEAQGGGAIHQYHLTMAAMKTCLEAAPEWLSQRIREAKRGSEPVQELAYLLADLRATRAESIWEKVKSDLLDKVPEAKARALVACIHRFRDVRELERLRRWVNSGGSFLSAFTLRALAAVDRDEVLAIVSALPAEVLTFARTLWMPTLLHGRREAIQRAIRDRMTVAPSEFWHIALAYTGMEQELDLETVVLMLDRLEADLAQHEAYPNETAGVRHALALLSEVWRPDVLSAFETRRGGPLEHMLAREADARAQRQTVSGDQVLENARLVLLKIGGESIAELAITEITHSLTFVGKSGIRGAMMRPREATRQALRDLAFAPNSAGDPAFEDLAEYAIIGLATLGEKELVLDAIMQRGRAALTKTLVRVSKQSLPFDDALVERLQALLQEQDVEKRDRAVRIAGISGRQELVPAVRAVLMEAPVGSVIAFDAILSLALLEDDGPETIQALAAHLRSEREQRYAAEALIRIGTPEAIAALCQALRTADAVGEGFRLTVLHELVGLADDPRERSRELWRGVQRLPKLAFPPGSALDALPTSGEPDVERYLHALAFGPDYPQFESDRTFRASAIRALGRLSPKDALAAAEWALTEDAIGREHLFDAILDIDQDAAIELVVGVAPSLTPELRWTASRVLRLRLDDRLAKCLQGRIGRMLASLNATERETGADLARFLPPGDLLERLEYLELEDHNQRVQQAASESARAQKNEQHAAALARELDPAGTGGWARLYGIVALSDPDLLMSDAAGVLPEALFHRLSPAMRQVLDEWVDSRRNRAERETQRAASTRTDWA